MSTILTNPTMGTSIAFKQRNQRGHYPSKTNGKLWQAKQKTPATLITALHTTQKPLEFRVKEEVKALLQANFDDNPLKYWDRDKSYAGILLQEAHSIVCVKLMRYNQAEEQDFKIHLREREEKQLHFRSPEDNKSPHSSATFMVNNHSEQK